MGKYTTGQYKLGEKYMFYVLGNNISSYRNVPDDKVPEAQQFFTDRYGVRLTTIEDLDAIHAYPNTNESIDASIANYYKRPQKDDISRAAVERAVKLARSYTPYNNAKGSWTEAAFASIPMVALSPNVIYGQPPPKQAYYEEKVQEVIAEKPVAQTPENVTPKTGTDSPPVQQPATVPVQQPAQQPIGAGTTDQPATQVQPAPANQGTGTATPLWKKYWYVPVIAVAALGIIIYMRKK